MDSYKPTIPSEWQRGKEACFSTRTPNQRDELAGFLRAFKEYSSLDKLAAFSRAARAEQLEIFTSIMTARIEQEGITFNPNPRLEAFLAFVAIKGRERNFDALLSKGLALTEQSAKELTQQAVAQKLPRTLALLKRLGLYKQSPIVTSEPSKTSTKAFIPNPYATSKAVMTPKPLAALSECEGFITEQEYTVGDSKITAERLLCVRTAAEPDPQNFPLAIEDATKVIQDGNFAAALRISNFWPSNYRSALIEQASQRANAQSGTDKMGYSESVEQRYAKPYVADVVGPRLLPSIANVPGAHTEKRAEHFNDGQYRETPLEVEIPAAPATDKPGGGFNAM